MQQRLFLKRIVLRTSLFAGSNAALKGIQTLAVLYFAAALQRSDFAVFGLLFALKGIVSVFVSAGLQEATASRLKRYATPLRRKTLFRRISSLYFINLVFVVMATAALLAIAGMADIATPAAASAVMLGALIGFGTFQANFHRLSDRDVMAVTVSSGLSLVATLGMTAILLAGGSAEDMFHGGLAAALVMIAVQMLRGNYFIGPAPDIASAVRAAREFAPYFVIAFIGWLNGYGANFIIDFRFDRESVAVFTFLFALASVNQLLASSFNMAWAPYFYDLFNNASSADTAGRNAYFFRLLVLALAGIGVVAVVLLPVATRFAGDQLAFYGQFRFEFALLLSAYLLSVPFWMAQNYFHVTGHGYRLMRLIVWSGLAGIALWAAAIALFGSAGLYIGFVAQTVIRAAAVWAAGEAEWGLGVPFGSIFAGCCLLFSALLVSSP